MVGKGGTLRSPPRFWFKAPGLKEAAKGLAALPKVKIHILLLIST